MAFSSAFKVLISITGIDQKLMGTIQSQSLLLFLVLPNGIC